MLSTGVVSANNNNGTDIPLEFDLHNEHMLNTKEYNLTSANCSYYFTEEGNLKSVNTVNSGDTLTFIGTISNRNFIIDRNLNIVGGSNCLLQNCSFIITKNASGSSFTNLHIVNLNKYGMNFAASNCTVNKCSIFSAGDGAFNIILNPTSCFNNIANNYLKAGSHCNEYESRTKSVSNIVLGYADYNYIANNYLECDDANSIYLSKWSSNSFIGGISNYNFIYNNTIRCMIVPTSWCYGIQIFGKGNKIDSNRIIGTYRGISGDDNTTIVNNAIVNLTGKDYDTYTLTGAEYAIISGSNSIIKNNQVKNSIIYNSAIYAGVNSSITGNKMDIAGKAHGIHAVGDNITIDSNDISVTSGCGIYQNGQFSGLFISNNNISASFGVGILIKKVSSVKYPKNVTISNNNVKTYNKYSINIKDVDKNTYFILGNNCTSKILTPDSESGLFNNTCLLINISGTFDDLTEALEIIEDGGIINIIGNIHLIGVGSTEPSGIVIDKSVIIEGNNYQINAHESCVRIFNITHEANVILKDLLLCGCHLLYDDYYAETLEGVEKEYTGAVIYNMGNLTIINSTFVANKANIGGAIYNGGNMNIFNSSFRNNHAVSKRIYGWENEDDGIHFIKEDGGGAGAIYNDGLLNIKNTTFHNNLAESSTGAIYNDGLLNMDACFIFSNKASGPAASGGAIYTSNNATINNTVFLDNRASQGGVIVCDNANLIIENSDLSQNLVYYDHFSGSGGVIIGSGNMKLIKTNFTANTCQLAGGVIATFDGYGPTHANILVDSCNFNNNFAGSGGVIYNVASGTLNVLNSIFNDNKAGDGAAILNLLADMIINGSSFNKNIATNTLGYGGYNFVSSGIVSSNGATNIIVNSDFFNNINADGSGTVNLGGYSIIDNSSFIANLVKGNGGGVYVGDALITNTKFINNTAKFGNSVYINYPLHSSKNYDNGFFDEIGNYHVIVHQSNQDTNNDFKPINNNSPDKPQNTVNNTNFNSTNTSNINNVDFNNSMPNNNENNGDSSSNNPTNLNIQGNDDNPILNNSSENIDNKFNNDPILNDDSGNFNSLSGVNNTDFDNSLSSVGEIPNMVGIAISSLSPSVNDATYPSNNIDKYLEASASDESKAYVLKKFDNRKFQDSNSITIIIICVFILLLLLIIGYKYGKKDNL